MVKPLKSESGVRPSVQFSHFGILDDGKQSKGAFLTAVISNVVIAAVSVLVGIGFKTISGGFLESLSAHAQYVIVIGIIAIGYIAHFFKRVSQYAYGFIEVIFGGASAVNVASGMRSSVQMLARWTAIVACTYIVARGFNNMYEAKEKSRKVQQSLAPALLASPPATPDASLSTNEPSLP